MAQFFYSITFIKAVQFSEKIKRFKTHIARADGEKKNGNSTVTIHIPQ